MSKTVNTRFRIIFLSALLSLFGCTAGQSSASGTSGGPPVSEEDAPAEESTPGEEQKTASVPKLELMEDTETDVRSFLETSQQMVNTAEVQIRPLTEMQAGDKKKYTVMIYMVGSNLESRFGAATKDIEEMFSAGIDYSDVNVLLYTGGSRRWNIDLPSDRNCVLDLSAGGDPVIAETAVSADMGAAETLSAFVNFCTDLYPAEHYGLICWDHGGGPLYGYGADELYRNDTMLMEEMKNALDSTAFNVRKLDFIGFDACLMGSLEVANTLKDYADYMIASQELEAGDGWDYSFLRILNETEDPAEIGKGIVSAFTQYYEEKKSEFSDPDVTLSLIDLSKIPALSDEADHFAAAMLEHIDNGGYADICRIRNDIKMYGIISTDQKEDGYDLVDIGDMADRYAGMFANEARSLKNALDEAVVDLGTNVTGASGLSMYYPSFNQELLAGSKDLRKDLFTEEYTRFMDNYTEQGSGTSDIDWTMDTVQKDGDHYTLQLTDEQYENAAEAYYSIFYTDESFFSSEEQMGYIIPASTHNKIDLGNGSSLEIPAVPGIITIDDGEGSAPWQFRQIEVNKKNTEYRSYNSYLYERDRVQIDHVFNLLVKKDSKSDELQIEKIYMNDGSAGLSGKNNINIDDYKFLEQVTTCMEVRTDDSGRILPHEQWEHTGSVLTTKVFLGNNISFQYEPVSSFTYQFSFQVVVKDIYGGYHGSRVFDLERTARTETETGGILYTLDEHGWVISDASAAEGEVVIPDQIDGKPVCAAGAYSFYNNDAVTKVTLPESVKVICNSAFYDMEMLEEIEMKGVETVQQNGVSCCFGLTDIRIPDTLKTLGDSAFGYCGLRSVYIPESVGLIQGAPFRGNELEEITVSENNPAYTSVDGVLFTKDKKILVEYPQEKGTQYQIPEGTEEIGFYAFYTAQLQTAGFPETLKKIDNCAFYGCEQLTELDLPESLEYIGGYAFGDLYYFNYEEIFIDTVNIGKNVKHIGDGAFSGQSVREFTADPENPYFAASGMFILNKSGETILQMPHYEGSTIVVPDGVKSLKEDYFGAMYSDTEYYLPDSLYRFPVYVFSYADLADDKPVYDCIIHCNPGSAAEEYAKLFNIQYDYDMELQERQSE